MRLILIIFFLNSCSSKFYHDGQNVCNKGTSRYDKNECEKWKQNYPKEYNKYLKRDSIIKLKNNENRSYKN